MCVLQWVHFQFPRPRCVPPVAVVACLVPGAASVISSICHVGWSGMWPRHFERRAAGFYLAHSARWRSCVQNGPFLADFRACFGPLSTIVGRTCRTDRFHMPRTLVKTQVGPVRSAPACTAARNQRQADPRTEAPAGIASEMLV